MDVSVYIVTDIGYGDCGKGSTVDYLARQGSSLVVRHNGGPQAGHNVVTDDGVHHCFSQYGSGTLAGATTFLSRFMFINPLNMMLEAEHLSALGVTPSVFVDADCVLITPWHTAINRLEELSRGDSRHGSCGQGVGVAVKQFLDVQGLSVKVKDIADTAFWPRLEAVRMYLEKTYKHLSGNTPEWKAIQDDELPHYLVYRFRRWLESVRVVPSSHLKSLIQAHEHTIFEGAQGVLLDQDYGFHPHTTWSTCTHDNALTLLKDANITDQVIRLGVLRTVTTRHGEGPHPTEDIALTERWSEPHNTHGAWQGAFRVGHLDLVAHRYAVKVCGGVDKLVVTHLDCNTRWMYCSAYAEVSGIPDPVRGDLEKQKLITEAMYRYTPELAAVDTDGLLSAVETHLGVPVAICSRGPACKDKAATVLQLH
jgi:adenylosuccinate synthase